MREVDALDGWMARAADSAAIHYRMLNASKGAAVQGPRIQADRKLYREAIQNPLAAEDGITLVAGEAAALRLSGKGYVEGLDLADGSVLTAGAVVLATGTFLGGRLFRGEERMEGGRIGEAGARRQIGRAQLWTPVTNAHIVCSLLRETHKQSNVTKYT